MSTLITHNVKTRLKMVHLLQSIDSTGRVKTDKTIASSLHLRCGPVMYTPMAFFYWWKSNDNMGKCD